MPEGVVCFELPSRGTVYQPSEAARVGLVLARWGAAILHELAIEGEQERLALLAAQDLQGEERLRVEATAALYTRFRPPSQVATRGLHGLTPEQKATLARQLVELLHDRATRPDVVKRLGKIYSLLGVDPQTVFSALHEAGTGGGRSSEGLDARLVEARLQETRQVERLLEGIFVEEASPSPVAAGLQAAHRTLLERLLERESWRPAEFDTMAGEVGLPSAGAMDLINDTSLDRFDELALEGDDPIYVNEEVVRGLL
jgi:hypothetical protein